VSGDGDGIHQVVVSLGRHPLLASVGHDLQQVLRMHSVQNVKEVLARRALILRKLAREVHVHLYVLLELGPQRLDRELIIAWDFDGLHLGLLQQLLPAG